MAAIYAAQRGAAAGGGRSENGGEKEHQRDTQRGKRLGGEFRYDEKCWLFYDVFMLCLEGLLGGYVNLQCVMTGGLRGWWE